TRFLYRPKCDAPRPQTVPATQSRRENTPQSASGTAFRRPDQEMEQAPEQEPEQALRRSSPASPAIAEPRARRTDPRRARPPSSSGKRAGTPSRTPARAQAASEAGRRALRARLTTR